MFRPSAPRQHRVDAVAVASIPTRHIRAKRIVPVLRRRYPKKARIAEQRKVLDSWHLLQASNGKYPETATEVNAEGHGFTDVVDADFSLFTNLEFIELSDNNVAFADILCFPRLHDLYLNCCGIRDIPNLSLSLTPSKVFPAQLTHLSLAFNELRIASIANLCVAFTDLISLNLSHNELSALPSQMRRLCKLRNLNLSDNELCGAATWRVLASLPALVELDLSENRFAQIPSFADSEKAFARLEFLNLSANRVRCSEHILPIQRLQRIAILDLRRNAFLDEIWSSIKQRMSAAKHSQTLRYEDVFVPRHCDVDGVVAVNKRNLHKKGAVTEADAVELPRPCDFGRIYWELVLTRGIVVVVDDAEHQNVFELQPILNEQRQPTEQAQSQQMILSQPQSEISDSELDTNVRSLLKTQMGGADCRANKVVAECMEEMHKLLYK